MRQAGLESEFVGSPEKAIACCKDECPLAYCKSC